MLWGLDVVQSQSVGSPNGLTSQFFDFVSCYGSAVCGFLAPPAHRLPLNRCSSRYFGNLRARYAKCLNSAVHPRGNACHPAARWCVAAGRGACCALRRALACWPPTSGHWPAMRLPLRRFSRRSIGSNRVASLADGAAPRATGCGTSSPRWTAPGPKCRSPRCRPRGACRGRISSCRRSPLTRGRGVRVLDRRRGRPGQDGGCRPGDRGARGARSCRRACWCSRRPDSGTSGAPSCDVTSACRPRSSTLLGSRRSPATYPPTVLPGSVRGCRIVSLDFAKQPTVLSSLAHDAWDVVVIDEAHAASGDSQRAAAVRALALRARFVLMLTATPHNGASLVVSQARRPRSARRREIRWCGFDAADRSSAIRAPGPSRTWRLQYAVETRRRCTRRCTRTRRASTERSALRPGSR